MVTVLTKLLVHGAESASWKDLYWINVVSDLHRNIEASKLCSHQLIFSKKGHWNFKSKTIEQYWYLSLACLTKSFKAFKDKVCLRVCPLLAKKRIHNTVAKSYRGSVRRYVQYMYVGKCINNFK